MCAETLRNRPRRRSISIGDALAAGVLERTRELAMLRAVGVRGSRVFQMVLLEGAEIGLLGLGLAMMVGLALGVFWVKVQFQALLGWKVDLHFPSVFALSAVGLTVVLCLAGSMFPALRAARIAVPVALRDE